MQRFLLILLLLPSFSFGQNLVPNPSFEDTVSCPWNSSQVYKAVSWDAYGGSPDYFHSCSPQLTDFSVPYNWGGYQPAASGNAYCALGTFAPILPNHREIIGAQLITSMGIGTKYFISFQACLSYSEPILAYIATDKLGALFTTTSQTWLPTPILNNFAHVFTDSIITDSINWTRISGSFVADSAYQHIRIGNFFDSINTDTIVFTQDTSSFAYYYIDDVCVSTDSTYCANYSFTSIHNIEYETSFRIYPNPTTGTFTVQGTVTEIQVYDLFGRLLLRSNKEQIDMSSYPAGIYMVRVGEATRKLILQ